MLVILLSTLIPLFVIIILIFAIYLVKQNKKKKKENAEKKIDSEIKEVTSSLKDKFGGKDNILEISSKGSRVTVLLKDISLINKDEINKTFDNVMFMSNKVVFLIGSDSEKFKQLLEDNISKEN